MEWKTGLYSAGPFILKTDGIFSRPNLFVLSKKCLKVQYIVRGFLRFFQNKFTLRPRSFKFLNSKLAKNVSWIFATGEPIAGVNAL